MFLNDGLIEFSPRNALYRTAVNRLLDICGRGAGRIEHLGFACLVELKYRGAI